MTRAENRPLSILFLAVVYVAASALGLSMASVHMSVSPVWPPTGIAIAALLLGGSRLWPGVFLGALAANLSTGVAPLAAAGIAVGNTLEALTAVHLVRRFIGHRDPFDNASDVLRFVLFAGFASTAVSATIGTTSLCATGEVRWERFFSLWLTWWLGDAGGAIIVAPLILSFGARLRPSAPWLAELAALLGMQVILGFIVFTSWTPAGHAHYPLQFLTLPLLLWSALKLGPRGVAASAGLLSSIAIWGTLHGFGPFARESPNESLLLLQGFIGTITVVFLVLAAEIAERKRVEKALRENEDQKNAVFKAALDCIITIDEEGRIVEFNPAAEKTFGYTRSEVLGREMAALIIPERLREPHRKGIARYLATGEGPVLNRRLELTALRTDGSEFPVELVITHLPSAKPHRFTGFLRDITENKRVEAENALLYEESQNANRLKDEFLAVVSHELRNPLHSMFGWLRILQESNLSPPDVAKALAIVERNAVAQARLIDDLLDVSRIAEGKLILDMQPIHLSPIVEAAVESIRPAAKDKRIQLDATIDPKTDLVTGDATRLQQVIDNLLTNAIKFTPEGGMVRVEFDSTDAGVRIRVVDTGQGIEPEFLPFVFNRFRQADGSTTRRHGGLGLGLTIVRHLVELHGGSVEVTSAGRGFGTQFTVVLPHRADA